MCKSLIFFIKEIWRNRYFHKSQIEILSKRSSLKINIIPLLILFVIEAKSLIVKKWFEIKKK